MLSEEQLEAYRNMSQEERWREVEALMTYAWRYLQTLPAEEVQRRLDLDAAEHDKSDQIMLAHLRKYP